MESNMSTFKYFLTYVLLGGLVMASDNSDNFDEHVCYSKNINKTSDKISTNSSTTFDDSIYDVIDELNPDKIQSLNADDQLDKAFECLSIANGADYNESAVYYVAAKWLDSKNQSLNSYLQHLGFKNDLEQVKLDNTKSWLEKKAVLIEMAKELSKLMQVKFE